jgi:hypothetical protein
MIDKSFIAYIAESKTEYKYLLKFAVNDMTDHMIDCLESCLVRYNIKEASAFRKTPIQESPLDFPNIKNTPVFICNLTLAYPASLDFLRTYVCNSMGISPSQLVVYSENDPRQIETDLFIERSSPEYKEKYKARLGADYEETGDKDMYGEKYNMDFLKELEKVRGEREQVLRRTENPEINHGDLPVGYEDFNSEKNMPKDDIGLFGRVKKQTVVKPRG